MFRVRRVALTLVGTAALVASCTSITIPSNQPARTIPPGFTIPPIELPSGFVLPTFRPGSATCSVVTVAEVNSALGATFSDQSSSPTECSFVSANSGFPLVVVVSEGPLIDGVKLLGQGEDLTIGSNRAFYSSTLLGDGVYVEKGGNSLTVQAFAQTGLRDQLIALANIAVNRF